MRYLLMLLTVMIAMNVQAQGRRLVSSDGTNLYMVSTNTGISVTNNLSTNLTFTSAGMGNLSITTNGIVVTNNFKPEDLRFPAQAIRAGGLFPPSYSEMFDGLYVLSFSKSQNQTIEGVAQFPHTWDNGTIEPHLHCNTGTFTNGGTSVWHLVYTTENLHGAVSTTTITNTMTNVMVKGTNWQSQYYSFGSISAATHGMTNVSAVMYWKVSRLTDDPADTQDSAIWLSEFDIHYRIKNIDGKNP